MRQPNSYTTVEGGKLIDWPEDLDINSFDLDSYGYGKFISVEGGKSERYRIHSILWKAKAGIDTVGRWDTINRWTQKLKV